MTTSPSPRGPNPSGLCMCGCGEKTKLAGRTDCGKGYTKGQPNRFVSGHQCRRFGPGYIVNLDTGCHMWQGAKNKKGYGILRANAQTTLAHVHFYEKKYGPVPPGKELDHFKCDDRACCNPDHVKPVTHTENVRRGRCVKLTITHAREIRELGMLPGGVHPLNIACIYGVSRTTIDRILTGERWCEAEEVAA